MFYLGKVGVPVGGQAHNSHRCSRTARAVQIRLAVHPLPRFRRLSYTDFLVRGVSDPQTSSRRACAWAVTLASPGGVPRAHLR